MEFSTPFTERWSKDVPSAVKCLQNFLDSYLTFLDFPEQEWISLHTTNVIERLNRNLSDGPNRWRSLPEKMPTTPVSFYQHQDGNALEVEPCGENALQSPFPP